MIYHAWSLDDWRLNITIILMFWESGHFQVARPFALQSWNTWHSPCLPGCCQKESQLIDHFMVNLFGKRVIFCGGVILSFFNHPETRKWCCFFGPFAWLILMRGKANVVSWKNSSVWIKFEDAIAFQSPSPDSQSHRLQVIGRCSATQHLGNCWRLGFRKKMRFPNGWGKNV